MASGIMAQLPIRTRLVLLSGALLLFLLGTCAYLNQKLAENAAGMNRAATLIDLIEEADDAQIAFGEMRYWLTDLAVSMLTLSERNATAARQQMQRHLDVLAQHQPRAVAEIRVELQRYEQLARRAVDEYTNDRRVIGNSLLAQASLHSVAADQLLAAITNRMTDEAIAAREQAVREAKEAARVSRIVVVAAIAVGAFLTFLVRRSIAVPLRQLVVAMDGLNAGNLDVTIPAAGPDEIGAMARTLAAFRDTLEELRRALAQLEALRAVGRAVGSTLDLEAVLGLVVARAIEFSGAAAGMIYEYDEPTREFRFRMSRGADPALAERLKTQPIRYGEGAVGRAAISTTPMQIPDLREPGVSVPQLAAELVSLGYRSLLAAPLLHEQTILGGLIVVRRQPGSFSDETVRLVEAFAIQSAHAVRNAKLFEQQLRREADLRAAHDQLKAAQVSLIQSEKMASLGQLTAGIAHEIKNPLNFVNNFADLSRELLDELKEAVEPPEAGGGVANPNDLDELIATLNANLSKIAEHGRRADGIVTSMLLHSRGGSGERRKSDLNALVEEALNLAFHGARAQDQSFNVALERDFGPDLGSLDIVPQDITRVFLNLFGNAFYTVNKRRREAGGASHAPAVKVTTRARGAEVEIRVRDNGVGMPAAVRDQVFTPFFTTKPTGEGTGLGLSISYDVVVQEHGGTIAVDSREGEFTEFTVRLPRDPPVAATAPTAAASGAAL
ncbi:MAG TPA: ATP-binding protein [Stellaceae bacterium]|nr:ATP-binding protein [Stellaceae bacterium]